MNISKSGHSWASTVRHSVGSFMPWQPPASSTRNGGHSSIGVISVSGQTTMHYERKADHGETVCRRMKFPCACLTRRQRMRAEMPHNVAVTSL